MFLHVCSRCALLLVASALLMGLPAGSIVAKERPAKDHGKRTSRAERETVASFKATQPAELVVCREITSAEAAIHSALDKPTVIEFVETPLIDVATYLSDYHKIPIQLDKKSLQDAGVSEDLPMSCTLREISLRSALNLMLNEHDLAWIIDQEVLIVTSRQAADTRRETCIYTVSGLLGQQSADDLANVVRQSLIPFGQREADSDVSIVPYRDVLIVRHTQAGQRQIAEFLKQLQRALSVAATHR
jgi:hypothetical protein